MPNAHPDLWQHYQATRAASTAKYARDIAAEMEIGGAELTAARLDHGAVRLSDGARTLIAALECVGETECICRNEHAVHEQVGQFTHRHLSGHVGPVLNLRALDLRLFPNQWTSAFHLNDSGRQSIQFFDHHGDVLLKVYATTQTNMAAWDILIVKHRVMASAPLVLRPPESVKYAGTANGVTLKNGWHVMTDVHRFSGLLCEYQLPRQQAFHLMSDGLACRADRHTLPSLSEAVRQEGNETMIFIDNRGCVQIFTGALGKLTPMRG